MPYALTCNPPRARKVLAADALRMPLGGAAPPVAGQTFDRARVPDIVLARSEADGEQLARPRGAAPGGLPVALQSAVPGAARYPGDRSGLAGIRTIGSTTGLDR